MGLHIQPLSPTIFLPTHDIRPAPDQTSISNITIKMALSIFHHFTSLPYELRLNIWEFAVRPTHNDGGLHQFAVLDHKDMRGPTQDLTILTHQSPFKLNAYIIAVKRLSGAYASGNRSASLWDAGLWTSCKELREVITKYSKQKDSSDTPSAMMAVKNGQSLDVMAHPSRDLFCFTPKRPSSEILWSTLFHYPPFSSLNGGSTSIQNIAMEFDPSWNIDPPEDIHELLDEFTTRGCVARAVNARAKEYAEFKIWLIDRGATRSPDKDREFPPHVFYDCEREYAETERNEILHDTEEEYRKTAWWFIEGLTRLGTPYYAEMRDPLVTYWNCFYADSCLGVLTCKRSK